MAALKLFFSLISGDMYYVEQDETKNLDKSQIPLNKKPDPNCKKCYGRFYVAFETVRKYYIPCPRCMRKCVDWDTFKSEEAVVEMPRTTNEIADHEFIKEIEKAGF